MNEVLHWLSWACLLGGSFFVVVSSLAVVRLPDYFSRIHGAGITDTVGAGLIVLGLALQAGFTLITFKLVAVLLFLMLTGPVTVHALAKTAHDDPRIQPVLAKRDDRHDDQPD